MGPPRGVYCVPETKVTDFLKLLRDYASQSGTESNYSEVKRAEGKLRQLALCEQTRQLDKMELAQREELKEVEKILSITDPYVIRLMNESQRPLVQCLNKLLKDNSTGEPWKLARASKHYDTARQQHIKDYVPEVYTHIEDIYKQILTPKNSRLAKGVVG